MSKVRETQVNHEIKASHVRLVGYDGVFVGVVQIEEALKNAKECNADLVAVDLRSDIPVCKILDYGKFKYDMKRKMLQERKSSKKVIYKEIRIAPHIDTQDYCQKIKSIKGFIVDDGLKVRVIVRVRGRVSSDSISSIVQRIINDTETFAILEGGKINDVNPRNIVIVLISK